MSQTYTSANTSINRTKLPAVYRKVTITTPFVLDYGCGKYTAHIRDHVAEQNAYYLPYDPYNQPEKVNEGACQMLNRCAEYHKPVTVICSNVLNVINDRNEIKNIAKVIRHIVRETNGVAYITVYEGDKTGTGRVTGKDQYQRNEPLRNYLKYFNIDTSTGADIHNGMIVVRKVG